TDRIRNTEDCAKNISAGWVCSSPVNGTPPPRGIVAPIFRDNSTRNTAAFIMDERLVTRDLESEHDEEIAPTEDLMREHGVLKRVLLAYGEIVRRLDARKNFPPEALVDAAAIIRDFIEDYHE